MDMVVPLASACHYRPTPRDLIPIVRMDKAPPVGRSLLRSHSQIVLAVAVYIGDPPIRKGLPQKAREAFFHQIQSCQLVPDLLFGPLALIDIPIDAHPAFELAARIPDRMRARDKPTIVSIGTADTRLDLTRHLRLHQLLPMVSPTLTIIGVDARTSA